MRCSETVTLGIDDQLELEDETAERRARLAPVLLDGDDFVEGISALARLTPWSRQQFTYARKNYPELAFVRKLNGRDISMVSSMSAVDYQAIEARVHQEQQDRGRSRGRANKRPQLWHVAGERLDWDVSSGSCVR